MAVVSYVCVYCDAENADKKCGACKQAWYCSRECQISHYKVHKHSCAGRQTGGGGKLGVRLLEVTRSACEPNRLQQLCT